MMKLSQLVSSALEDAKTKIASAQDAEKSAGAATELGERVMGRVPEMGSAGRRLVGAAQDVGKHLGAKSTESAVGRGIMATGAAAGATGLGLAAAGGVAHHMGAKKESSAMETATEAMKFAESLEHLAMLFPKLSSAQPEALVSPNKGPLKDTSTKATSLSAAEASTQGGAKTTGMQVEAFKSPYAKQAAVAILEAKIAQSNALLLAGQAQAATSLAKQAQAEFEASKRAYDEEASTPKGNPQSLAVNRHSGDFPVTGNVPADNAGMISMTKRQAKTEDVRSSARQHLSEPALSSASDKGLVDNVEHIEGAKIANIFHKAAARKEAELTLEKMKANVTRGFDRAVMTPKQKLRDDLKSVTGV